MQCNAKTSKDNETNAHVEDKHIETNAHVEDKHNNMSRHIQQQHMNTNMPQTLAASVGQHHIMVLMSSCARPVCPTTSA